MDHPERSSGTVGSLFKLLEKEKKNPNHRKDFEKIRAFINENTGFKFDTGFSSPTELNIKAFAKEKNEIS